MHTYRPSTEQINQEIATEARGEHLGDNIQIGYQGRLQDDGDVGGVEELDGVSVVLATVASWLDGQINPESLWEEVTDSIKLIWTELHHHLLHK